MIKEKDVVNLIKLVRNSHDWLPAYLKKDAFLHWVVLNVNFLSKSLYQRMPHWHHWKGHCIKMPPLELWVGAMGLFGSIWYFDIMLRKARDRHSFKTREYILEYRNYLDACLDAVQKEIDSTRDIEAEERHKRDAKPTSRLRHILNTILWRH